MSKMNRREFMELAAILTASLSWEGIKIFPVGASSASFPVDAGWQIGNGNGGDGWMGNGWRLGASPQIDLSGWQIGNGSGGDGWMGNGWRLGANDLSIIEEAEQQANKHDIFMPIIKADT